MKYRYLILFLFGILCLGDNSVKAVEESYHRSYTNSHQPSQRSSVILGHKRASIQLEKQKPQQWVSPQLFNCRQSCTNVMQMHCKGSNVPGYYNRCIHDCKDLLATNNFYKQAIKQCEERLQENRYLGQIIESDYKFPIADLKTFNSKGFLVRVLRKKTAPDLGIIDFAEHNDHIIAFLPYPTHASIKPADFVGKMIEFNELESLGFEKFTNAEIENIKQDDKNKSYMDNDYKAFLIITSPMIDTPIKTGEEEGDRVLLSAPNQVLNARTLPID